MAKIKIQLVKSPIGYPKGQRETVKALGLKRIGSSVEQEDTAPIRGMINKVAHLLKVQG